MQVISMVFAALAAVIHVYIFVLESLRWDHPSTRRAFGISTEAEAATTRQLAFNQGFYNLFLALTTIAGIATHVAGFAVVGTTLMFAGTVPMAAAGLVLLLSSPRLKRAAFFQLGAPALSLAFGLLALSQ